METRSRIKGRYPPQAASGMAGIGIPPHVIEAALNHKTGTIKGAAAVYDRYSDAAEKRQALSAWSRRLAAVISGEAPSNVVALASAKGAHSRKFLTIAYVHRKFSANTLVLRAAES